MLFFFNSTPFHIDLRYTAGNPSSLLSWQQRQVGLASIQTRWRSNKISEHRVPSCFDAMGTPYEYLLITEKLLPSRPGITYQTRRQFEGHVPSTWQFFATGHSSCSSITSFEHGRDVSKPDTGWSLSWRCCPHISNGRAEPSTGPPRGRDDFKPAPRLYYVKSADVMNPYLYYDHTSGTVEKALPCDLCRGMPARAMITNGSSSFESRARSLSSTSQLSYHNS